MSQNEQYEERIVCFLDILGFKAKVKNSENGQDEFDKIVDILDLLQQHTLEEMNLDIPDDVQMRSISFSDSLVLSFDANHRNGMVHAINKVLNLQIQLMSKGVFIRGGMAVGKLFHQDGKIFGPALIRAYEMESKFANYPRVILPMHDFQNLTKGSGEREQYEPIHVFALKEDQAGFLYIDYLGWLLSKWRMVQYSATVKQLKEAIVAGLSETEEGTRIKFIWLANRFNECYDKVRLEHHNNGQKTHLEIVERIGQIEHKNLPLKLSDLRRQMW